MALITAERLRRIDDEFTNIEYEADLLRRYLNKFAGSEPADDLDYFQQTHTSSSATEKIYSGLERIVEFMCVALDNRPAGKSDRNWHRQLLVRASHQLRVSGRRSFPPRLSRYWIGCAVSGIARGIPTSRASISLSFSKGRRRRLQRLHC